MAETAGAVASFLGLAIDLGKCIVAPIKRQFDYLRCFDSNIRNLRNESDNLDDARIRLQMQVDRAKSNLDVILPEVETWLKNASDIKDKKSRIENEISNVQSGCLAIKARFSLSKRAEETTEGMKELREKSNFRSISLQAPPAATQPVPLERTYEFESRKQIEEDIMTSLREKNVNMIGICGMGGVGKTTMAKRIMNRAIEKKPLFDEVVMAVISEQADKSRIQLQIAESLDLKLDKKTPLVRAQKLRARLMDPKKKLLVLDDVWESLELEELGIPCESGSKGCTILLTSRNRDVLSKMNVQMIHGLRILSEEEAWFLFKERVGTCVDEVRLHSIAKDVIKECGRLPIALVTVGAALKNENDLSIWKDALQQLRRGNPEDIPDVISKVYNPLALSYDFLGSERAKSIFLLCCLFGEDANISLEFLTFFAMGLQMFEGIRYLEDARDKTRNLIKILKSRFLLLDGLDDYHVRMHDVVRDVSIFIASNKGCINCKNSTWFSSFVHGRAKLPAESDFPNLRLLLIDEKSADEKLEINDSFFKGMEKLDVLSMKSYSSLRSLPLPKNLQTLIIDGCVLLESISVVGELLSLEILICRNCYSIKELPSEIGRLKSLRLLEFSDCWSLKKVASGVISGLVGLEELKMVGSFDEWEAEDNEGKENAGLKELESLNNLTCLVIHVRDYTLAAEQMRLPSNVVKFDIAIGHPSKRGAPRSVMELNLRLLFRSSTMNRLRLKFPDEISIEHWISMQLLRSTEDLELTGDGANNLDFAEAQNVRSFTLEACSTMENIIAPNDWTSGATIFPRLESLQLCQLANLQEICDIDGPIPSNSLENLKALHLQHLPDLKHLWKSSIPYQNNVVSLFCNLSSIFLLECNSLRNLFSLSVAAKDCLPQLERLKIIQCKMMEEVVSSMRNEEEENQKDTGPKDHDIRTLTFPKLKELELGYLPNLTTFCKGIESIEFPMLTEMYIRDCPKPKSLVVSTSCSTGFRNNQNNSGGINYYNDDDSLHLSCNPEKVLFGNLKLPTIKEQKNCFKNAWRHQMPTVSFTGLEELGIYGCHKFRSLFSFSIVENLVNLRRLDIYQCNEMVNVIEDDEEENVVCGGGTNSLFSRLQYISLEELPKLEVFCQPKYNLDMPFLEDVIIHDCPNMKSFTWGSITAPNLKRDLNGELQQRFLEAKEESTASQEEIIQEDEKKGE